MFGSQGSIISYEPRVVGASFNPANRGKVVPEALEGVQGVYVIRVNNVTNTPIADANVDEQRRSRYMQAMMRYRRIVEMANQGQGEDPILGVLRESASISDNRAKHF